MFHMSFDEISYGKITLYIDNTATNHGWQSQIFDLEAFRLFPRKQLMPCLPNQ